jgi:hypothetical protein
LRLVVKRIQHVHTRLNCFPISLCMSRVVNNPHHKAPYAERCEALLKRERHGTGSSQVPICLAMPNNTKISTIAPFHPPLAMCLDGPPSAPMDQAYFPCLLQSPSCQATMLDPGPERSTCRLHIAEATSVDPQLRNRSVESAQVARSPWYSDFPAPLIFRSHEFVSFTYAGDSLRT